MIRLVGIVKEYPLAKGGSIRVLGPLSLAVSQGESLAVVGPSGSGKSTLLSILGCLERPTSGTVFVDGRPLAGLPESELARIRRERIGFVFQRFHLVNELSVLDNVALPLVYRRAAAGVRNREAMFALETVGLAHAARKRPYQLSGGEQQRVAVARASVTRPAVMLADEPTGNLDSASGSMVVDLLLALHRQNSSSVLVMVTHNLGLARRLNGTVYLRDGVIHPGMEAC